MSSTQDRATAYEPSVGATPVQAVLALLPAALWIVDGNLRITTAFGPGFDSLGLRPELDAIVGLDLYEYFGTDDPHFESIANHLRALHGQPVLCESRLRGRIAEVRLEPLREGGEIVGVIGLAVDVTERRALESELRQALQNQSLGALAGGIAHDVNNVLATIMGYAQLAIDHLDEDSPAREHLAEVLKAGDHGAAMTSRLLGLSRCSELEPCEVDLNDVVLDIGTMLRRLLGAAITLVTELDPEVPSIATDPNQLRRLLVNLAINARDAMPAGGVLTIATGFDPAQGLVELAVRDTGTGMAADVRERVFEPFFTTKPEGAGTGLGLATVHGIVTQSGGSIEVESAPGKGTTFSIALPAAAA